jgi:hypothetical protein
MLRLSPGLGQGASRHLEKTIAHQSRAEEFKSGKNFPAKIDLKTNYPISEVKKKTDEEVKTAEAGATDRMTHTGTRYWVSFHSPKHTTKILSDSWQKGQPRIPTVTKILNDKVCQKCFNT